MWKYSQPVNIEFEKNHLDILSQISNENSLVICSKRTRKNLQVNIKLKSKFYSETYSHPSIADYELILDFVSKKQVETVIAIGGGSIIDIAKVVVLALKVQVYDINILAFKQLPKRKDVVLYAFPTNHGTSSELTKWSTVWDYKRLKKFSIENTLCFPDYAIYDISLTQSLDHKNLLITSFDSLSHAFEALWSNNSSELTDLYAIKSIVTFMTNLTKIKTGLSYETRRFLVLASIYSGFAFSNTRTGISHAISYPLTLQYKIPHGIATSITLPYILEYVQPEIKSKTSQIFSALNYKSAKDFEIQLKELCTDIIPFRLSLFGVSPMNIEGIAKTTVNSNRFKNNIIEFTHKQIVKILNSSL